MRTRAIVVALLALLGVLGAAWFLATHDRVQSRQWVGPSGEARVRQFLAAQRLAERMGMTVSEVRSLADLGKLPPDALLLIPSHRQVLHAGKIAEIVAWVDAGGHLIVEAEPLGVADPLLEMLGVQRTKAEALRKPLAVELPESGRKISVYMTDAMALDAGKAELHLDVAGKLVSFTRGRGVVSAAASLEFARNPWYDDHAAEGARQRGGTSIGAHGHAELFWEVLALTPGDVLQVYFRPERLSLWGFLRQHAAPALIAGGLLLALWLWSIAPRFGPVAPDAPPGRRRLLDHLRASGRYYWARGLRSRLVVAARDAALRRIARAQPDFAAAGPVERISRLSSLAGIPKEDAASFLAAAGAMRGADFIKVTQQAQRVHSALEKGSRK
jgi:hypothetical protein